MTHTANILKEPSIFITKFVTDDNDSSIGYLLSNNTIGAHFNDDSKFVLDADGFNAYYFERSDQSKSEHFIWAMNIMNYPLNLETKLTSLLYFKDILRERKESSICSRRFLSLQQRLGCIPSSIKPYEVDPVYVTDVFKKGDDTIFILSNGTVQYESPSSFLEFILNESVIKVSYVKDEGELCELLVKNESGLPDDLSELFCMVSEIFRDMVSGKIKGGVEEDIIEVEEDCIFE